MAEVRVLAAEHEDWVLVDLVPAWLDECTDLSDLPQWRRVEGDPDKIIADFINRYGDNNVYIHDSTVVEIELPSPEWVPGPITEPTEVRGIRFN